VIGKKKWLKHIYLSATHQFQGKVLFGEGGERFRNMFTLPGGGKKYVGAAGDLVNVGNISVMKFAEVKESKKRKKGA